MSDFDPDAYLADKKPFDPSAYLGEQAPQETTQESPSMMQTFKSNLIKAGLLTPDDWTPEQDKQRVMSLGKSLVSPPVALAKGAVVDPVVGAAQLAANVTGYGEQANKLVKQYKDAVKPLENTPVELIGAIVSPVNKLFGPMQGINRLKGVVKSTASGATLAALQPSEAEQFWDDKAMQALVGGVLGAGIPLAAGVVGTVRKIWNNVNLSDSARLDAIRRELLDSVPPGQLNEVLASLRGAKEFVPGSKPTVAQALAETPAGINIVRAETDLSRRAGAAPYFAAIDAEQQAARQAALSEISGTEGQRAAVAARRDAVTGRMREGALQPGEQAQAAMSEFSQNINNQANNLLRQSREALTRNIDMIPDSQNIGALSKRVSQNAGLLKKQQLESLQQNGLFPVFGKDIISQIDNAISNATSDQSKLALGHFKKLIESKMDSNGIINSRDLYENVRKTANQDIAALFNQGDKYASGGIPQQAAKAVGNVKKFIDSAIDKTSNGLWSQYLKRYAQYSEKLNRMEVGDYLAKKLNTPLDQERAGAFALAVQNAAGTIKKSTGIPRYEKLNQILTPDEIKIVNGVSMDLERALKAKELAKKTESMAESGGIPITVFKQEVTAVKDLMRAIRTGRQKEVDRLSVEIFSDPNKMATFLENIPKNKIGQVTQAIMKMVDSRVAEGFVNRFGGAIAATQD